MAGSGKSATIVGTSTGVGEVLARNRIKRAGISDFWRGAPKDFPLLLRNHGPISIGYADLCIEGRSDRFEEKIELLGEPIS
jgi:hypothetical protein